tara:strand:- start:766 stop:1278 length:513 start_codon:yes stop_codon:yes gene_type:complete
MATRSGRMFDFQIVDGNFELIGAHEYSDDEDIFTGAEENQVSPTPDAFTGAEENQFSSMFSDTLSGGKLNQFDDDSDDEDEEFKTYSDDDDYLDYGLAATIATDGLHEDEEEEDPTLREFEEEYFPFSSANKYRNDAGKNGFLSDFQNMLGGADSSSEDEMDNLDGVHYF